MTKALMAISCPLTTQLEPEITGDLELGELVVFSSPQSLSYETWFSLGHGWQQRKKKH